ncbi:release factor [Xylariaceae sp. FL0804]|nr:release factor [Xylariaceae sp. FL0804]
MFSAKWMCQHCSRALARSAARQFVRPASTEAPSRLPPVLLQRARNIATEHDQLTAALATEFDMKTAKRIGELSRVASALKEWEAARSSLQELSGLLRSKDEELQQLAHDELSSTHASLDSLENALSASLTPRDPFADMPCMLEVRPGPGGMEGRYFADAVFRMYCQYCSNMGFRTKVVKYEVSEAGETNGHESALQEAVLEVQDAGAYDRFRSEAGMHRVQRVPATESKGRTHTSAVAVWVLPSFPEAGGSGGGEDTAKNFDDPDSLFYVNPAEVRVEKMRAGGAGGQHVNKTESAIRLTHEPTGVTVSMQDSRSQHRNREVAWELLRSRLAQRRREAQEEQAHALRNSVLSKDRITRGDKIRTYNYSQDRCTDHRSGLDAHNLPDVLAGGEGLARIIDSAREWLVQRDIAVLIADEQQAAAAAAAASEPKKTKK